MTDRANFEVSGSLASDLDTALATDAATGDAVVQVVDASAFVAGDEVAVGFVITADWISENDMGVTPFADDWKAIHRRRVVDVDVTTDTLTLDVPLREPVRVRDGGAVRRLPGLLRGVGIEHLGLANAVDDAAATSSDRAHAIQLVGVVDSWVRDVRSFAPPGRDRHLQSGGLLVADSARVTVQDVTLRDAQNRGEGGNGYLVELQRANEVLVVDVVATGGRHNFIQNWDFGTSGCVWLRTNSSGGRSLVADWDPIGYASYSEFHHSLAMANLIDESVASDGWQGENRQGESSGAGHSATQNVWWNIRGGGYLRSLQYGDGYIIGTDGMDVHVDPAEWDWNDSGEGTAPEDWTEGLDEGTTLEPASLYEDQLRRRLGG
jgi:hypothetical protein